MNNSATGFLTTGSEVVVPPPPEMSNDEMIPNVDEKGIDREVVPSFHNLPSTSRLGSERRIA